MIDILPSFARPDALTDASYSLVSREVEWVEREVMSVIYSLEVAPKIWDTVKIPEGMVKYEFQIAVEPSAPILSKNFMSESFDKIARDTSQIPLMGIHKDFMITMQELDASRNSQIQMKQTIETLHIREMSSLVAYYKERYIWRAGKMAGADPGDIDPNSQGIANWTGIDTFEAGAGKDDHIDQIGDIYYSVSNAIGKLLTNNMKPPFYVLITPKAYALGLLLINATSGKSDIQLVNEHPHVKTVAVSKEIIAVPESTDKSCIIVCARETNGGEPVVELIESYSPRLLSQQFIVGTQFKTIWSGTAVVYRPKGICIAEEINQAGA